MAIIEPKPYIRNTKLKDNKLIKNYFKNVKNAENKIFNKCNIIKKTKKTEIYKAKRNEINFNELLKNKIFLNSNYYIVFGSSIIKNEMLSYLLRKKALNIHMAFLLIIVELIVIFGQFMMDFQIMLAEQS